MTEQTPPATGSSDDPHVPAAWRGDLVLALRLRDVPGARIGDILAEVEEFCADSGLDAPTAFGPPDEYAKDVAAGSATTGPSLADDLRTTGRIVVGFVGLMVVLGSVGTDGPYLVVTTGWLLALPLLLGAAVLTVRALGWIAAPGARGVRAQVVIALVLGATVAAAVTLGLVLDTPVATVPDALAAAVGLALLVGDAVVGTVRARRRPTADLVTTPGTDPVEVRRRNVRADVLGAWLLPGMAVVGVALLLALDALLDLLA